MPPAKAPDSGPEETPPAPSDALNVSERRKFDQLVREKVSAGLPKSDAEDVARRQINEDKAAAK